MKDLRDPDRPDTLDRPERVDAVPERPDLRDAYADDEWDIFSATGDDAPARNDGRSEDAPARDGRRPEDDASARDGGRSEGDARPDPDGRPEGDALVRDGGRPEGDALARGAGRPGDGALARDGGQSERDARPGPGRHPEGDGEAGGTEVGDLPVDQSDAASTPSVPGTRDGPASRDRPVDPDRPGQDRLDRARPGVSADPEAPDGADADGAAGAGELDRSGGLDGSGGPDRAGELDRALARLEDDHPAAGQVVRRLAADTRHRLDLTRDLADPARRDGTLAVIRELADGRLLAGSDLQRYRQDCPGQGRLFAPVPDEVNRNPDGTSIKDSYLARCELADPARRIGALPDAREREAIEDYATRLATLVEPLVTGEVEDLAADLPGATVSVRTKDADDILDKVRRMSSGSDTRPPREDYRIGDVVDAVGARITVADTTQLGELLDRVRDTFGTGEGGRVLELDNMYVQPKASNPSYRVIPLLVAVDADELPYTYELQLTTRRASVAADLEHNTIYKPYAEPSDSEKSAVRRMMAEAAALDQEETRAQTGDGIDNPAGADPGGSLDGTDRTVGTDGTDRTADVHRPDRTGRT